MIIQEPLRVYTIGDDAYQKVQGEELVTRQTNQKVLSSIYDFLRIFTIPYDAY